MTVNSIFGLTQDHDICYVNHVGVFACYIVGDMSKNPSSQYGLKAQDDIDPRGIRVINGPMR